MSGTSVTPIDLPKINVFAKFPIDLEKSSWNWIHCLTFRIDTLNELQLSQKPYKWIRYAIGVVIGAGGHLSLNRDSPDDIMEYEDDLRPESADLYYHISDVEKDRMYPIDPDAAKTSITLSICSSRRNRFRDVIIERDGYIENYTKRRGRDSDEKDVVCEIDDVRNGVLLNRIAHPHFGKEMAFLMTPNFAMTTRDIDPTADATQIRCTVHLFDPDESCFGDRTLRSGFPARLPDSPHKWPPNILLDAIYGRVVFQYFAAHAIHDIIKMYRNTFYPEGITNFVAAETQNLHHDQGAEDKIKREHDDARDERAKKRASKTKDPNDDVVDDFEIFQTFLPYILIPPKQLQVAWRKKAEEEAKSAHGHLENYVGSWAKDVANAGSSH